MKKKWTKLALALVLILLLPVSLLVCALNLPSYYGESYYAQLPELYHRLYDTEGPKLVIIGGSNVAFGVDTMMLEETLAKYGYDYTVCSFGLYAAVGTSAMLDLSEDAISEGDIVVLAIEPSSDTMSTYFGSTAFWKCCEETPEMLLHLSKEKQNAMAGAYIPYLQERLSIFTSGSLPAVDGVYAKASFDSTGNMIYHRAGNAMALGFDTASPVDPEALTIAPDFAQQVNEFCQLARDRGAEVYLSFSPVNRSALTGEDLDSFFRLCNSTFDCPVISDPDDYVLDSGWFYDNNFHLNSAGSQIRTVQLAKDLLAQLGCYAEVPFQMPSMPDSIVVHQDNNGDEKLFRFEPLGSGWIVTGVTEEGMAQSTLTVPSMKDGGPVVGFAADALAGCSQLRELTLPGSMESLPDGLFADCSSLERLVLEHTDRLCSIGDDPFAGAGNLKIFVPAASYPLYRDGDGCEVNPWSAHLGKIYTY